MFLIASSLAITTYFPRVLFNRVDDADDRAVNRRACFTRRGGRSRPAFLNDYHNIALACVDGIEREHRSAARLAVGIDRLNEHYARVSIARILLCGDDIAQDASQDHFRSPFVAPLVAIDFTCDSESTMPTIVQSVGASTPSSAKLASLPRHQKTSSPAPAPTESIATRGLPTGRRSPSRTRMTSSLRPSSVAFLTVETTFPMTRASCISQDLDHDQRQVVVLVRAGCEFFDAVDERLDDSRRAQVAMFDQEIEYARLAEFNAVGLRRVRLGQSVGVEEERVAFFQAQGLALVLLLVEDSQEQPARFQGLPFA